jgi:hypothetical protein
VWWADGGHAEVDGVARGTNGGDGVLDGGALTIGELGEVLFDLRDQRADSGDLVLGGQRLGACPGIEVGGGEDRSRSRSSRSR